MPLLTIHTNVDRPQKITDLLGLFSRAVAEMLGKPEHYVMVWLDCSADMVFAAEESPLAYLELKSIGLPQDRTPQFSEALCLLVEQHLGIPRARVYIEFSDAPRALWGWNGATF